MDTLSKGFTDQQKINVKTPLRTETNEKSQRPTGNVPESVKTDRGSFKIK